MDTKLSNFLYEKYIENVHQTFFVNCLKLATHVLKVFENKIFWKVYQMIFKKLILFFVLSSVSFYEYYNEKQKRPGTSYLEHQVQNVMKKIIF